MLTLLPYEGWKARGTADEDACRVRDDTEALACANARFADAGKPVVVVEEQPGIPPRVRFLYQDLSGTYSEVMARSGLAEQLDLVPHPEGGWAQSVWTSSVSVEPAGYAGTRASATALHYVLGPTEQSRWHRVRSDELWLWQAGGALRFLTGGDAAKPSSAQARILGPDLAAGERLHIVVPGGTWQAALPLRPAETLITCVVSPGFDEADYQIL